MPTILIADDDHKITDMLRRTLSYEGYSVLTAADGREALTQAQAHHPDLVVLDWMMPGLNGVEVARRLRAAEGMPILMLTARDAVEDRVEGLDGGADDYLVKPFAPAELLARIRSLLRRVPDGSEKPLRYTDLNLDPVTRDTRRGERLISSVRKNSIYCPTCSSIPGRSCRASASWKRCGVTILEAKTMCSTSISDTCGQKPRRPASRA